LVFVVIALGLVIGCDSGPDRPATFSVTGTVTLDGDPVEGAAVNFIPTSGGKSAAGVTDASGKYSLTTFASGDGAVPGEYNVTIAKYEGADDAAEETGEGDAGMMSAEYDSGVGAEEGDDVSKSLLPEKYNDPNSSGLKATVTDKENSIDFPLES
jgi:hypothetical protein